MPVNQGCSEVITRTMVFVTLIAANIFLTLVNRSFYYSIFTTLRYKNNLVLLIIGITIAITALLLLVPMLAHFFEFEMLHLSQVLISVTVGFLSVRYEIVKWVKQKKMIRFIYGASLSVFQLPGVVSVYKILSCMRLGRPCQNSILVGFTR